MNGPWSGRRSKLAILAQKSGALGGTLRGVPELRAQDVFQFGEYRDTDNRHVVGEKCLKKIRAQAARGERTHQYVRVENHPHDTSRNTSSSVK